MLVGPTTRVLVTGASRGIGRATAEAFAARGCTVGVAARSAAGLEQVAAGIGSAIPLPMDVGDRVQVEVAVARFAEQAGGLDVVVANAGIAHYAPVERQPVEQIEQMTRVNWLGTVYTVKAALPLLLARGAGHIVVVCSGAGLRSFPWAAAYGATKAAQRAFAQALRHELAGTGVEVTVVYPGRVESSLHDHELGTMPDWYENGPAKVPAATLAAAIVDAVEHDREEVFVPPLVRLMGAAHGISPRLSDRLLRRIMGRQAAPRR